MTNETRRISVEGTGRVRLRPDLARLRLGCFAEHDRAALAFDACSSATAAVIAALREAGAGDDDLSSSGISLSRRHDSNRYVALNGLVVTVRPPERAGEVLAVVVDAGGDALTINNVEFDVADDSDERSQARQEAVRDARRTAEQLASAAGVRLGRILSLEESVGRHGGGQLMRSLRAAPAAAAPAPVEVGDQEVAASVSVVFEIGDEGAT
ncbi:MAG TPA: SIMPL domain-containing protein [Acidimicrobiales bacterium]|nr:SIMPL domain-containing protein [Acidimicrobiales bacterium]